jgi:flavorubredoxin
MDKGLSVRPFNVVNLDSGRFAAALIEASTIIFASPTVLDGPHPSMAAAAYLVNALKPKTRYGGIIGSYGWGNDAMQNSLALMLPNLAVEWFAPVMAGGVPKPEAFAALDRLADDIGRANAAAPAQPDPQ